MKIVFRGLGDSVIHTSLVFVQVASIEPSHNALRVLDSAGDPCSAVQLIPGQWSKLILQWCPAPMVRCLKEFVEVIASDHLPVMKIVCECETDSEGSISSDVFSNDASSHVTPPVFRSVTSSLFCYEKQQEDLGLLANTKRSRRSLAQADTPLSKQRSPGWESASQAADKPVHLQRVSTRMRRSLTRMSDRFEEPERASSRSLSRTSSQCSIASSRAPSVPKETRPSRRLTLSSLASVRGEPQSKWDRLSAGHSATPRGRQRSQNSQARASANSECTSLSSPAQFVNEWPMHTPKRRRGFAGMDTNQSRHQSPDVRHSGSMLMQAHTHSGCVTSFGTGPTPSEHSTPSQPSSARSRIPSAASDALVSSMPSARMACVPKPSEASWALAIYHCECVSAPRMQMFGLKLPYLPFFGDRLHIAERLHVQLLLCIIASS
jgi:hypothetical protein